jgi:hypothetical protein
VRIRCIQQDELYKLGQLPIEASEDEEEENENGNEVRQRTLRERGEEYQTAVPADDYVGYKWGIFLRAPDVFFRLRAKCRDTLVPFTEIAEIKRGVTSGADDFFYPRDITEEELARFLNPRDFKEHHGIRPSETGKVRVVKAGDGSAHLIEAQFLEPVVFNLMEVDGVEIASSNLEKCIFVCSLSKDKLRKQGLKYAVAYIRWGEQEGFGKRPTCANRERWYDLRIGERGAMLWTKTQRYRHIVPYNQQRFIANCNLYDVSPKSGLDAQALCAVLNSTVVALSKQFFGRQFGGDPVLKTEVIDLSMMLVPDVRRADKVIVRRLCDALTKMRKRLALHLVDVDGAGEEWSGELALSDRQELDDAVLELLGISDANERQALRAELYAEMTKLYREIRATEKKMQKFRALTARHGRPSPQSLADEIWEAFEEKPTAKALHDFVPASAKTESVLLPPGKATLLTNDMFNPNSLRIGSQHIPFGTPERAEYALQVSEDGISGKVEIPLDPVICQTALRDHRAHRDKLNELFASTAAAFTADEQMQERIVRELWRRASRD